ncbi:hypothetical protein KDAU_40800 [Dictyobacter aurantiacus]|uniref:Uncharacterized protein n=1 Tax=Dictyobacter aurantiacus TaxID=1936993 RepID=A0A401ZIR4_9CHLR|nr:hypothetical protein KDAU_40800 [Dictyobacter aurantiacus]
MRGEGKLWGTPPDPRQEGSSPSCTSYSGVRGEGKLWGTPPDPRQEGSSPSCTSHWREGGENTGGHPLAPAGGLVALLHLLLEREGGGEGKHWGTPPGPSQEGDEPFYTSYWGEGGDKALGGFAGRWEVR